MVQRWMAEGVEKDETGEWVLFADHEREVSAQAVVDGIVRNRLVEALREALDGWSALSQGGDMERTRSRIAELRKLLGEEPPEDRFARRGNPPLPGQPR